MGLYLGMGLFLGLGVAAGVGLGAFVWFLLSSCGRAIVALFDQWEDDL
jgi:hypothetical protein